MNRGSLLFAEVPVQVFSVQKGSANDFCLLLLTFAKGLDRDQARHFVVPYLDPDSLALWWYIRIPEIIYIKNINAGKANPRKRHACNLWTMCLFILVWFFASLSTIFQLCGDGSSWVEPVLSKDKCVLLKTQHSVAGEARTRGPSV